MEEAPLPGVGTPDNPDAQTEPELKLLLQDVKVEQQTQPPPAPEMSRPARRPERRPVLSARPARSPARPSVRPPASCVLASCAPGTRESTH